MAALNPEVLCPGHGVVVVGEDRVRQMLVETAELLESLHEQTVALMNEGATLDKIIHTVRAPEHLEERPFLRPVYDDSQYIVRNIWRLYGGWYEGDPARLRPAPESQQAEEVAMLAGGVSALIKRAREVFDSGDARLASHLIEWAVKAAPDNKPAHKLRAEIYGSRAQQERALMTSGVFRWAERESNEKSDG
jgi:alkyl sulfatase BDS1-like metallo-beta-lactamase superfamily hydrolase